MVAVVGSLATKLVADNQNLTQGLRASGRDITAFERRSGTSFRRFDRQARTSFTLAGRHAATFTAAATRASAAMMRLAGGTALASFLSLAGAIRGAQSALSDFDDIGKRAARSALDPETWQALVHQAELADTSVTQLSTAMETFARNAGMAAVGKGRMAGALKELNPELLKNIQAARTQEERLRLVADALDATEDASQKAAIAQAAFGGAGAQMIQVLKGGSSAMDEMERHARSLGIIIDRHLIARSEELSDELATAARVAKVNFQQALIDLAPVLIATAEMAARLAQDIRGLIDAFRDLEGQSSHSLDQRMRTLGLERLNIENDILDLKRQQDELTGLTAGVERRYLEGTIVKRREELEKIATEEQRILEILNSRAPAPQTTPPPSFEIDDDTGSGGSSRASARDREAEAAIRAAEAVRELIRELEEELALVGASEEAQRAYAASKRAGAHASDEQRQKVIELTEAIHQQKAALEEVRQAQDFLTNEAYSAFESVITGAESAEDALKKLAIAIAKAALQALLLGTGPLGGLLGGGIFKFSGGGAVHAAEGGHIRGPGGPTEDKIPAMLSDGEYVVNAKSTRRNRSLLEAINSGRVSAFSAGGMVPSGEAGAERCFRRAA